MTTTNRFAPTHRIIRKSGAVVAVMLCGGPAYSQQEWNAADAADYECLVDGRWLFQGQPFSGTVHAIADSEDESVEYRIAFAREDGSWDVVETFQAIDDTDANLHAETVYAGREWYVLDATGRNINGGQQD